MSARSGHIKLSRKLFDDPLWTERRPYSRFEAWVDLIQRAQWRDRTFHSERYGAIELRRGEVLVSVRKLALRWGRSQAWVQRFLRLIHQNERVSIQRTIRAGTVYRVVNYDAYQRVSLGSDTPNDTQSSTPKRHKYKAVNSPKTEKKDTEVSETPVKTPESDPGAPQPSSLTKLPKSTADLAYQNWGRRFGAVNYPRLRNVLVACVDAGIPQDHLPDAVEAYADWFEGLADRDKQFNTPSPERFGTEARRWARLGQMDYVTLGGFTERGLLLARGISA